METIDMTEAHHTTGHGGSTNLPALIYQGQVVNQRNEMLSLTDMWRAAGGDEQKAPAKWRALPNSKSFAEHVGLTIGKSDSDLFATQNGGRDRGTWAHWHIAMAYAKYLDHNFHMWCNTVVRERMEHRAPALLPADITALIERTDGIARQLSHRVKMLQDAVTDLQEKRATPALDFGGTVSAHQMIEMAGIEASRRQRGTAQLVTNRMLAFCAQHRVACVRTPAVVNPSEPYRFPHAMACDWLLGDTKGAEIIRNQIERARAKKARRGAGTGQAAFQLVPTSQPAR